MAVWLMAGKARWLHASSISANQLAALGAGAKLADGQAGGAARHQWG